MEMKHRKILIILLSAILLATVSAESSFIGFAGVSLDVQPEKDSVSEVFANGVIAGQYSLNDTLSLKGNFQFGTGDIVSHGLFQETPSVFAIRELSASWNIFKEASVITLSAVLGDQSSFGSDAFVRQHLGVRNFSSSLLTPLITPVSAGMNGFSGIGGSFVGDFGPKAVGVYVFYDREKATENPQINADVQYAFQPDNAVLDATFGMTVPFEQTTPSGEKVFVLIRQVKLRTGISALVNISDNLQMFFQSGISDIILPDFPPISLDHLYLFVEPRLSLPLCNLNISFFCLSDSTLRDLTFISQPLGCNLNVETLPFPMFRHTASTGINIAACAGRNILGASEQGTDVVIAPYLDYSLATGTINTTITVHPLDYADVSKLLRISFSYKAQF